MVIRNFFNTRVTRLTQHSTETDLACKNSALKFFFFSEAKKYVLWTHAHNTLYHMDTTNFVCVQVSFQQ